MLTGSYHDMFQLATSFGSLSSSFCTCEICPPPAPGPELENTDTDLVISTSISRINQFTNDTCMIGMQREVLAGALGADIVINVSGQHSPSNLLYRPGLSLTIIPHDCGPLG